MRGGAPPPASDPGTWLPERRVRARNLFRDAANRIHDDVVARRHGYEGALVAGVTVYGYLSRLAVTAWGMDWVALGTANVRFRRPVYDGDELALRGRIVARSASPQAGEVVAEIEARSPRGDVAATLVAGLAWGETAITPDLGRYPAAPLPAAPRPGTAEVLAGLDPLGTPAISLDASALAQAAQDLDDPWPEYRGPRGVAHPGLLLRQANRALVANVELGAWIHVSSDVTHLGVAHAGERLETRGRVARVYERGGRGWADLDLLLVVPDAARPIARIRHTAIYRLDGPAPAG